MRTIVIWCDYRTPSIAFIPEDSSITQDEFGKEPGEISLIKTQHVRCQVKFVVLEGDYRYLDGVYINSFEDQEKQKALSNLVHDKIEMLDSFPLPLQNDDIVIVAGFLP